MDEYLKELTEIKHEITHLQEFGKSSVIALNNILARYDGVIEQLFYINQPGYQRSIKTIQIIEKKMLVVKSQGMPIAIKRTQYIKVKQMLLRSIGRDLVNET
ncbi:hypothetical protein [Mucilaginibacter aquaedulcis]|uniref:hypothetical protein n=1 Tax=Mucilaginibacter aquaedulcis TaxID=1187081 RepID=UPI0025B54601|nr:hypothetical protein [Mucilaginibacter aquaedulcis]MDN3548179.1 hypothetical protein [Mucilaginibacter aquaedulcis]